MSGSRWETPSPVSGLGAAVADRAVQPPTASAMCLLHVPAEEVVVLALGTAWQIPWELLMLGPFAECVLDDRGQMRLVTAGALLCSAARRSSPPDSPLEADDYQPMPEVRVGHDAARGGAAHRENGVGPRHRDGPATQADHAQRGAALTPGPAWVAAAVKRVVGEWSPRLSEARAIVGSLHR